MPSGWPRGGEVPETISVWRRTRVVGLEQWERRKDSRGQTLCLGGRPEMFLTNCDNNDQWLDMCCVPDPPDAYAVISFKLQKKFLSLHVRLVLPLPQMKEAL